MADFSTLCLRGLQVNPKPRPKDYNEKSLRYSRITSVRPHSANLVHKSAQKQRSECATRPKSANDVSLNDKQSLNRQSKLSVLTKGIFKSKKSSKYPEENKCSLVNSHGEFPIKSNENRPIFKEGSGKSISHGNFEECNILRDSTRKINGNTLEQPQLNSVHSKFTKEHEYTESCLSIKSKECNDASEFHEKSTASSSSHHEKLADCSVEERLLCESEAEVSENLKDTMKGIREFKKSRNDREIDQKVNHRKLNDPEVNFFTEESTNVMTAEGSIGKMVEVERIDTNLISLLVDLENDMPTTSCTNLEDNLNNTSNVGTSIKSGLNHSFCLLDDNFPFFNLDIEKDRQKFEVPPISVPHNESNDPGTFHCDEKHGETCYSTSSCKMPLSNGTVADTSAQIKSQVEEVQKILESSRENLCEDIVEVLSLQEKNFQHLINFEEYKDPKIMSQRPLCLGESFEKFDDSSYLEGYKRSSSSAGSSIKNDNDSIVEIYESQILQVSPGIKCPCPSPNFHSPEMIDYGNVSLGKKKSNKNAKRRQKSMKKSISLSSETLEIGEPSDADCNYVDSLTTLQTMDKEDREPDLLSSRPPPTGSESELTPRICVKDILSFLDDATHSCDSSLNPVDKDHQTPDSGSTIYGSEKTPCGSLASHDLMSSNQLQEMRLQEQAKGISLLKRELERTREQATKEREKLKKTLEEEHAKVLIRHQEFIEKLLAEKKSISEKCESLVLRLQQSEDSHKATVCAMEERHALELRNERERARLEQRAARDRWMREKTQKIQAATAKGAEGEVKRLVSEQSYQIEALWKARLDELRGRLEREAEEGMAKERELARKRLEERVEEMERFHQEERRKFLAEELLLRGRAEDAERRIREVEEEARKQRAEDLSVERARAQANLEKSTEEIEKYYQMSLSKERSQREIAIEAAKKEERQSMELERRKWEAKLKEQLKSERDRDIEKAVTHLTKQAEKTQQEIEARNEMTLRRMRERCDEQIQAAEAEVEKERKLNAEIRSQSAALLEENSYLKMSISRLEKELETAHKLTTGLYEERSQIRELVVEEWSTRVAALREEVGVLKAQVVAEKELREMELGQFQKEREYELAQVQKRVELAIAKKEEKISHTKSLYEAALQKCSQLQELLDRQRKDLLLN